MATSMWCASYLARVVPTLFASISSLRMRPTLVLELPMPKKSMVRPFTSLWATAWLTLAPSTPLETALFTALLVNLHFSLPYLVDYQLPLLSSVSILGLYSNLCLEIAFIITFKIVKKGQLKNILAINTHKMVHLC